MRRAILALMALVALALLPATANAEIHFPTGGASLSPPIGRVQCLHAVNHAGIDQADLQGAETAIEHQATVQVSGFWNIPRIKFCDHGWPIELRRDKDPAAATKRLCGTPAGGCHGFKGHPLAFVEVGYRAPWIGTFDHEVLEMLVDPRYKYVINGHHVEICDAVQRHRYLVQGRWLADWVTPAWFGIRAGSADITSTPRRFDWAGHVKRPLQVLRGGSMPARAAPGPLMRPGAIFYVFTEIA